MEAITTAPPPDSGADGPRGSGPPDPPGTPFQTVLGAQQQAWTALPEGQQDSQPGAGPPPPAAAVAALAGLVPRAGRLRHHNAAAVRACARAGRRPGVRGPARPRRGRRPGRRRHRRGAGPGGDAGPERRRGGDWRRPGLGRRGAARRPGRRPDGLPAPAPAATAGSTPAAPTGGSPAGPGGQDAAPDQAPAGPPPGRVPRRRPPMRRPPRWSRRRRRPRRWPTRRRSSRPRPRRRPPRRSPLRPRRRRPRPPDHDPGPRAAGPGAAGVHDLIQLARARATPRTLAWSCIRRSLGGVEVRLRHARDGLHASVHVEHPEALAVLDRGLGDLRRALEARGVTVATLDLSLAGGGQEHAEGWAASGDRSFGRPSGPGRAPASEPDGADPQPLPTPSVTSLPPAGAIVDVMA
ncbi:MAG: flagellar hook-length control protein FliK [Solirubrobacterales bacterium]